MMGSSPPGESTRAAGSRAIRSRGCIEDDKLLEREKVVVEDFGDASDARKKVRAAIDLYRQEETRLRGW